jgi:hypothetical protein
MLNSELLQTTNESNTLPAKVEELPVLNIQGLIQFQNDVEYIIKNCMREDIHYGKLPGTKNSIMYKPGLDLLCTSANILDLYDEPVVFDHDNNHRSYEFTCKLQKVNRDGSTRVVAIATGSASTMESKFRYESYYENQQYAGKREIQPEKVYDKHYLVIQVAKTRAKRNAVNAFFNPAGFINEPEPEKPKPDKPKVKQPVEKPKPSNGGQKKWNPNPLQRNNPDWFFEEIKKLTSHDEIVEFHETFELDEKFFDDATQKQFKDAYNARWEELKVKK